MLLLLSPISLLLIVVFLIQENPQDVVVVAIMIIFKVHFFAACNVVILSVYSVCRDFFAEKLLELLDRKCRYEVFGCEYMSKVNMVNMENMVNVVNI